MTNTSKVGTETLSYCTSCRMDLWHIIVSLQGDKIAKVLCNTCKKTHMFRAPKGAKSPQAKKEPGTTSAAKAKHPKEPKPKAIEIEWEQLMAASAQHSAKPYSTKATFAEGDKIEHPKFGQGFVGKTLHPNKVEVVFQTDLKILIHQQG
jgi:hypothetical protein